MSKFFKRKTVVSLIVWTVWMNLFIAISTECKWIKSVYQWNNWDIFTVQTSCKWNVSMNCESLPLVQFKLLKITTIKIWKTERGWALSVWLQNVYYAILKSCTYFALEHSNSTISAWSSTSITYLFDVFLQVLDNTNMFTMQMLFLRHWHAKLSECLTLFYIYFKQWKCKCQCIEKSKYADRKRIEETTFMLTLNWIQIVDRKKVQLAKQFDMPYLIN